VGPGTLRIHIRVSDGPILIAGLHTFVYFILTNDRALSHILDKNTTHLILGHLQISLAPIQQILYLFHVDLDHRHFHREFNVRTRMRDLVKHVRDHPRDHTPVLQVENVGARHRVRLPRRGLPVREHRAVESLHDALHNAFYRLLKDFLLGGLMVEYSIEVVLYLF
jgi:hypothetical protein